MINGSIVYFSECGVRYILGCLELLLGGHRALDVRKDVHDAFNERVDAENRRMAWGGSDVNTWYKNEHGRVTQNWPFTLLEYWPPPPPPPPHHPAPGAPTNHPPPPRPPPTPPNKGTPKHPNPTQPTPPAPPPRPGAKAGAAPPPRGGDSKEEEGQVRGGRATPGNICQHTNKGGTLVGGEPQDEGGGGGRATHPPPRSHSADRLSRQTHQRTAETRSGCVEAATPSDGPSCEHGGPTLGGATWTDDVR